VTRVEFAVVLPLGEGVDAPVVVAQGVHKSTGRMALMHVQAVTFQDDKGNVAPATEPLHDAARCKLLR